MEEVEDRLHHWEVRLPFFLRSVDWLPSSRVLGFWTRLYVSVKKESLLATIFSNILLTVGRNDIGLYAFGTV
jgi:hypothetical protein